MTLSLGPLKNLPLGQGRSYVVDGNEIAVFRQRDGRLFAVANRCPHREGPLADGLVGNGKVICPLHAHKFDLATGQGSEPEECVKVYAVEQIGGEIFLKL